MGVEVGLQRLIRTLLSFQEASSLRRLMHAAGKQPGILGSIWGEVEEVEKDKAGCYSRWEEMTVCVATLGR